jgi:hypothetical protein
VQCWRLTWSAVRVARFAVGAQAAQEYLVLAVGALPAGLLAQGTLIRRGTPPFQLEPLLQHVPVCAPCEVGPVPCHLNHNLSLYWHGDNLLAVCRQGVLLGFVMIVVVTAEVIAHEQ